MEEDCCFENLTGKHIGKRPLGRSLFLLYFKRFSDLSAWFPPPNVYVTTKTHVTAYKNKNGLVLLRY